MDHVSNGFNQSQTFVPETENRTRQILYSTEKSHIENELFVSLKFHIDSQYKLNQINQNRIRSFERFRRYCHSLTFSFSSSSQETKFNPEQFQNEYNRFDRNYRYWRKRIRAIRKQTKSSLSNRYQNLYDTLYELFAKLESLDQSKENSNGTQNQIYPEISINVADIPAPLKISSVHDQLGNTRTNFDCFVSGCLQKFCSQQDLLDHLFEKHSSENDDNISKAKTIRGRRTTAKKTSTKKQTTQSKNSPSLGRPKAQSSKKVTNEKKTNVKLESSTEYDSDSPPILKKKKKKKIKTKPVKVLKVLHCDFEGCQYSSTNQGAMKLHKIFHSDERPFKCDKCELAFKIKGDLKVHQNIHEGKRFECTYEGCTVNYATMKDLRRHVKIYHMKDAPLLQCSWEGCKYSSYNSKLFKIHQSVHSNERQFKCPDCDMAFKSGRYLWAHKLSHQKEHRFKCDFEGCGYSTNRNEYLKSHRATHADERPFVCVWPDCGQAFKTTSGLWSHKTIHENQRRHKCTWEGCDYAGNLWRNLQEHVTAVHEKKKKVRNRKSANQKALETTASVTAEQMANCVRHDENS